MTTIELSVAGCSLRPWRMSDVDALTRYANNRAIWLNLRDRFPHPYTRRDARDYVSMLRDSRDENVFAIDVSGEAVGSIGFIGQSDVERVSAEIGYWLGEPFWGRGIISAALSATTRFAFDRHHRSGTADPPGLSRLFALPFARNGASCRVLEKAGYVVEGRLRHSAIKDGVLLDQVLYACYADRVTAA